MNYWNLHFRFFPIGNFENGKIDIPGGYPGASGTITYIGKNCMQQTYNNYVQAAQKHGLSRMNTDIELLKVEKDAISMLVERRNPSRGDTFTIELVAIRDYPVFVILEFSSDTQYSYYFWGETWGL
jgi:hypothetical protein